MTHAHIHAGNNRKGVHLFSKPAALSASVTVSCRVALFESEIDRKAAFSVYQIKASGSFPRNALWEDKPNLYLTEVTVCLDVLSLILMVAFLKETTCKSVLFNMFCYALIIGINSCIILQISETLN